MLSGVVLSRLATVASATVTPDPVLMHTWSPVPGTTSGLQFAASSHEFVLAPPSQTSVRTPESHEVAACATSGARATSGAVRIATAITARRTRGVRARNTCASSSSALLPCPSGPTSRNPARKLGTQPPDNLNCLVTAAAERARTSPGRLRRWARGLERAPQTVDPLLGLHDPLVETAAAHREPEGPPPARPRAGCRPGA